MLLSRNYLFLAPAPPSLLSLILAPAPAPAPAIFCHLKLWYRYYRHFRQYRYYNSSTVWYQLKYVSMETYCTYPSVLQTDLSIFLLKL